MLRDVPSPASAREAYYIPRSPSEESKSSSPCLGPPYPSRLHRTLPPFFTSLQRKSNNVGEIRRDPAINIPTPRGIRCRVSSSSISDIPIPTALASPFRPAAHSRFFSILPHHVTSTPHTTTTSPRLRPSRPRQVDPCHPVPANARLLLCNRPAERAVGAGCDAHKPGPRGAPPPYAPARQAWRGAPGGFACSRFGRRGTTRGAELAHCRDGMLLLGLGSNAYVCLVGVTVVST